MNIVAFFYLTLFVLFSCVSKTHSLVMGSNQGILSFDEELENINIECMQIITTNSLKMNLSRNTQKEINRGGSEVGI